MRIGRSGQNGPMPPGPEEKDGRPAWRDPGWQAHALFAAVAIAGILGLWQLTRQRHPRPQDFGADYYWPLWLALVWALLVLLHLLYAAGRVRPPRRRPHPPGASAPELSAPTRHPGLDGLTAREREVLGLLAAGRANKDIARRLSISERTARTHVSNILRKLALSSRTEAALFAVRTGLVQDDDGG
jgi:DNA-binding CsgD family transcriptional regulator